MNLLILCHELPPIGGGAGNAALSVAREISLAHRVTIITSRYQGLPHREKIGGIEVIRVPSLRKNPEGSAPFELAIFACTAFWTAVRLHRQRPFDGCMAFLAITSAWVCFGLRLFLGVPYILLLRGADVPGFMPEMYGRLHRWTLPITRLCWRGAKKIIANSPGLKALAEQTAAPMGLPVGLVPNGVDSDFFHPSTMLSRPGSLQALFVGRLTEQKGLVYLLEAMAEQAARLKGKMTLEIVGEGPLKSNLEKFVERHALGSMIRFTPWLDKKSLRNKYQSVHLLAFPSIEEGMSNVILEAMSCGLPVLGMNIYGNAALIQDGATGFLAPPKNVPALGNLLVHISEMDPDHLSAIGQEGRKQAVLRSWSTAAEAFLSALTPQ